MTSLTAATGELLETLHLCAMKTTNSGPRMLIAVAESAQPGDADLTVADRNRGGVVELADVNVANERPIRELEINRVKSRGVDD